MTTPFQAIVTLATGIQTIKKKYPMVVTYLKHLQKCAADSKSEEAEVQAFRSWLLENTEFPKITEMYYKSSKPTVCFSNVYAVGSEPVVKAFETTLADIERLIFPDGRPEKIEKAPDQDMTPGVAAAMAALESNPLLSGFLDNIKAIVADSDISSDPGGIMETKSFKNLIKDLQKSIESGKFKLADISSTVYKVAEFVKDDLPADMNSVISEGIGIMAAAERGQHPDINRVMDLLKTLSSNK